MDAIAFLLKEHEAVKRMLVDINDPSHKPETKQKHFETLAEQLTRHEKMEQTLWYPFLKKNTHLNEIVKHLIAEEKIAAKLIKKFEHIKTDAKWDEAFLELKKDIEHHAQEEETKLFPKVKKLMSEHDLTTIGHEMYAFKKNYNVNEDAPQPSARFGA